MRKFNLFMHLFKPTEKTTIIDVGASEKEYQDNANIIEKKYPYPEKITVLGVDDYKEFLKRYSKVKVIHYSGDSFPLKDKSFDICWCNAVLEHVGSRHKQEQLLKEICRVSKAAFLTTPNRFFPMETHTRIFFLHYLPKSIFDKFLKTVGKSDKADNYMHLLGLRDITNLLARCKITNYRIIKNKILCFTIDFVVVIQSGLHSQLFT